MKSSVRRSARGVVWKIRNFPGSMPNRILREDSQPFKLQLNERPKRKSGENIKNTVLQVNAFVFLRTFTARLTLRIKTNENAQPGKSLIVNAYSVTSYIQVTGESNVRTVTCNTRKA